MAGAGGGESVGSQDIAVAGRCPCPRDLAGQSSRFDAGRGTAHAFPLRSRLRNFYFRHATTLSWHGMASYPGDAIVSAGQGCFNRMSSTRAGAFMGCAQPRRVKSIHAALIAEVTGQGLEIALRRDPFTLTEQFIGDKRRTGKFRMRRQESFDLFFAFFPLQRTDGEYQKPARLHHSPRRLPGFHTPAPRAPSHRPAA